MAHLPDIPVMGWKALWRTLQEIADAVNTNEPVAGSGLRIDQRLGGGTLISLADQAKQTTKNQDGAVGGGGGGMPAQFNWYGVKWQTVTVVDPATCVQSTLSVLTYTGNNNDIIIITAVLPQ